MKPLKVAHVVASLEPHAGSIALSVRHLPAELRESGIESTLLVTDSGESAAAGANCVRPGNGQALNEVRQSDLVHFHGWTEPYSALAKEARSAKKPYVISPLGSLTYGPYRKRTWKDRMRSMFGEGSLIRSAACLMAINRAEANDLASGKLNRDIRVLEYGTSFDSNPGSTSKPPTADASTQTPCLLVLGPIHPIEGLVPFLKATAELGKLSEAWKIVIAGPESGDWRKMLQAAVGRKGAADRVTFAEATGEDAQRKLLAQASVVVVAALHSRAPVTVLQAVAAGVPVVTTERTVVDPLRDVLQVCGSGRNGMREALQAIMSLNKRGRKSLGEKAREAGRAVIGWPAAAKGFDKLYRSLA